MHHPFVKILFVASECVPFAKAGGLGDVVGALPKALAALGHDARVLLPKYGTVDTAGFSRRAEPLGVPMGSGAAWCGLLEGRLPGSDVPIYLLEHDAAFGAPQIYGGEEHTIWGGVKFGILSRAAFELSRYLDWKPDLLHLHDWPSAWAAVAANDVEQVEFPNLATILTIHNMAHQPRFPPAVLDHLGFGHRFFRSDGLEDHGLLNPFKAGLFHSTMISTVSPRYSHEIRTSEGGCGLHMVVDFRGADLVGILNGIDEDVWNPRTDPLITARYSAEDLGGKARCKAALERVMGLDPEPDGPLLGVVSRLTIQKGLDVLAAGMERLIEAGARLALLGSGEPWLRLRFTELAARHPGRVGVRFAYDERLAHAIEAGSDLFLMPSRFEPCGLNQLYSQRYGTLPVVHATGGLDDTVEQCDPMTGAGTGFKMYSLSEDALVHTVAWAMDIYRHQKDVFSAMQRRAMAKPMGWDAIAPRYVDMYRWAMQRKGVVDVATPEPTPVAAP